MEHINNMKKDELIYLASPYSNGNKETNFKIISNISADLTKEGYTTISPITYGHTLLQFKEMPDDWGFWLNFCLTLLTKCDRLVVCKMNGWEESIGVEAEISYARDHGIPIEYYEVTNEYVHEIHKQEVIKKWDKAGFLDGLNLDNITLPIAKRVFNTGIQDNKTEE
jgi:hypothetical protein